MHYSDASELIAELIAGRHDCGPDCLCWELRRVPGIKSALEKIGADKTPFLWNQLQNCKTLDGGFFLAAAEKR